MDVFAELVSDAWTCMPNIRQTLSKAMHKVPHMLFFLMTSLVLVCNKRLSLYNIEKIGIPIPSKWDISRKRFQQKNN